MLQLRYLRFLRPATAFGYFPAVNQANFQLNFAQRFPLHTSAPLLTTHTHSAQFPIRFCCGSDPSILLLLAVAPLIVVVVVAVETTLLAGAEGFGFLVSGFGFPHEFCAIAADLFAALHNHWKLV